ncbi:hypothetical protein [Lactiplantibacillus argentoratensis]|uniref:hypothetical protein n=1 Tax=Lactiplantibacillus argentoratensis TaxID=271881 RepID=UPI001D088019|nr:hypothetical protein [Lactiplantibacillus argentoratensis]
MMITTFHVMSVECGNVLDNGCAQSINWIIAHSGILWAQLRKQRAGPTQWMGCAYDR